MYKLVNTDTNETIAAEYDLNTIAYKAISLIGNTYGTIEELKSRMIKNTRSRNGKSQQFAMLDYTFAIIKEV